MAKTNYSKAEEALDEGLRQMMIQHLHTLADSLNDIQSEEKNKEPQNQKKLLTLFKVQLKWVEKQESAFHQKIGVTKAEIKKLKELKEPLTDEDFEKIKTIKEKVSLLKKELEGKKSESNDLLVEKNRKKQLNKRFNTNDNWLPLH